MLCLREQLRHPRHRIVDRLGNRIVLVHNPVDDMHERRRQDIAQLVGVTQGRVLGADDVEVVIAMQGGLPVAPDGRVFVQ